MKILHFMPFGLFLSSCDSFVSNFSIENNSHYSLVGVNIYQEGVRKNIGQISPGKTFSLRNINFGEGDVRVDYIKNRIKYSYQLCYYTFLYPPHGSFKVFDESVKLSCR